MPDDRNDFVDPSPSTPGKTQVAYPSANIEDLIVTEDIQVRPEDYEPLPLGTPHPKNDETGLDLRLVWQGPVKGNDAYKSVRRVYATPRSNEDFFNYAIKYSDEATNCPVYIRRYTVRRQDYAPLTKGAPLTGIVAIKVTAQGTNLDSDTAAISFTGGGGSGAEAKPIIYDGQLIGARVTKEGTGYTSAPTVGVSTGSGATLTAIIQPPGAVLVKEEVQLLDEDPQIAALFVRVIRVYKVLPTQPMVTKSIGQDNLTPEKYRRLVTRQITIQDVAAAFSMPDALSGDQTSVELAMQSIAEAQLKIIEEIINVDESPLTGSEQDIYGLLTITETIVNDGTPADTGYLVKTSKVTPFGNGKSVKITVNYPADLADQETVEKSIGQDNLTPEKYRRLITRNVTTHIVSPSYLFPSTLSGDQTQVKLIQDTLDQARLEIVEEVIAVDESPLAGKETDEWGDLTIDESIVNDGTSLDEGLMVKKCTVSPIGNGKSIKIVISYVEFPTLIQTVVDEKTNIVTNIAKTIVAAGTTGGVAGNVVTEVNPLDKWRSIQIVSAIDVDNLPSPEPVNIMRPFSFPDQLIALKILPGSGTSNSSGGENGYSFSWDGELSVQVLNGYRGPCAGTRTRIYSVGVPSYVPVETVILPSTGTVIIFAGSQSQDVNGTTSKTATTVRARAVTVPNVLTAGIKQNGVLVPGLVVQGFYNLSPLGGTYDINLPASVPSGLKNGQQIIIDVNVERVRGNVYMLEIITIGAVVGSTYVTNAASFIAPPR